MVKIKPAKLSSAMELAGKMSDMAPGPGMDRIVRNANDGRGFVDDTGGISGKNGFWVKDGRPQIGDMPLSDFLRLTPKKRVDLLNSGAFSPGVMTRVKTKLNATFSSNSKASRNKGAPAARGAELDMMTPDGKSVKPGMKARFGAFVDKFSDRMKFGAKLGAAAWTVATLLQLAEANSGCYLVGPDGEEEKVSGADCSCSGDANPNATACCNACNSGGDQFLCPGVGWVGDNPPAAYVCPTDVPPAGRARQMRATMSVTAARAMDRATTLSATKLSAAKLSEGDSTTAIPCGCEKGGQWVLQQRSSSVFGVMADMLASAGLMIVDVAKGVTGAAWDIVGDGLGALTKPLTTLFIAVGALIGVAAIAGVVVAVAKARKKRGQRAPLINAP
jgi:hypothetical protein